AADQSRTTPGLAREVGRIGAPHRKDNSRSQRCHLLTTRPTDNHDHLAGARDENLICASRSPRPKGPRSTWSRSTVTLGNLQRCTLALAGTLISLVNASAEVPSAGDVCVEGLVLDLRDLRINV